MHKSWLPTAVRLTCDVEWTPDSGLTTAAMKIRRPQLEKHYKTEIESMMKETGQD